MNKRTAKRRRVVVAPFHGFTALAFDYGRCLLDKGLVDLVLTRSVSEGRRAPRLRFGLR